MLFLAALFTLDGRGKLVVETGLMALDGTVEMFS